MALWAWRPYTLAAIAVLFLIALTSSSDILKTVEKMKSSPICGVPKKAFPKNPVDGVCRDVDIRYNVRNLELLRNCTVIEGDLHITLIEYVPQAVYDMYTFPELKEITGHLMMFKVFGLETLRNMFPNLAVIRGQTVYFNTYSLFIHECRDMKEIGLIGLTDILNGTVRISKNFRMCYINTIDWTRIIKNASKADHTFIENREESLCPDYCNEACKMFDHKKYCWSSTSRDCQKNLGCRCKGGLSCMVNGTCCHEYCLGGCSGLTTKHCHVCKDYQMGQACLPECPADTYILAGHRCLTDKECLKLPPMKPDTIGSFVTENTPKLLTLPTRKECVFKCPNGYMVNDTLGHKTEECIPCLGTCPKVCNSTKIYNTKDSEQLRGCTKVQGNLDILLYYGGVDIDRELKQNLLSIKEVTGYVKIMRSYGLVTLNFLQNLEIIRGERLVNDRYSLVIIDNPNLERLFREKQTEKMKILNGSVNIIHNRMLCPKWIDAFFNATKATEGTIKPNGDMNPCVEEKIPFQFVKITDKSAVITLNALTIGDVRQITGYMALYKKVSAPLIDKNEGRDRCSLNDWMSVEVQIESVIKPNFSLLAAKNVTIDNLDFSSKGQEITIGLEKLEPFTTYAVLISARTLTSTGYTADSDIKYMKTSPRNPGKVQELRVESGNEELHVSWKPPLQSNGIIGFYKVLYYPIKNDFRVVNQDYCLNPMDEMTAVEKRKQSIAQGKALLEKSRPENSSCCPCLPNLSDDREEDKISNIMFEDKLISLAFTATCHNKTSNESVNLEPTHKLPPVAPAPKPARLNQRRKRSITNSTVGLLFSNPITAKHLADNLSSTESTQINRTLPLPNNGSGTVAMEVEVKDTKITLPNLKHYQEYQISVKACHDSDPFYGLLCTEDETEIAFGQTQPKLSADNLDSSQIYVGFVSNKTNEAFVTWEPPVEPNGRILNYFVKLSRESTKEDQTFCVNNNHTREYHFTQLLPGNYSIQIKVVTRAGKGNFSEPKFIFIPEVKGSDITGVIVGAVISPIVIVIILIGVLVYIAYKWKSKSNVLVSNNPNYIKTEDLYCPDEWEIARETLRLLKELGQGSFGTVYEGLLEDPKTKTTKSVAIKTLGDKADFYERLKILKEATTMKGCECFHVVKLIGVVSKGQPAFIVMELMSHGDLRNYLRKCRVDEYDYPDYYPPTANQIRQMAGEIADGMAYLAHRKIVHRDLAARNCLVAEDGTVKIADFGMARDVYMTDYYRKDNRALLPVRWMAPESLMDGIFTTMSDIWSYGIVLWEMVTLAEQPYQGLGNEEVLRFVSEGRVMTAPIGCPVDLYDLMKSCWAYNPKKRPTFMYLIECLAPHMNERFQQVSFFFQEMSKDGSDEEPEAGAAGTVEQAEPCVMEVEEAPTEAYQDPDNNFQRIQKLKAQGSSASGSLKSSKEARTVSSEEEDNVEIDTSPAKISPSPSTPSTSSHHQPESRRQSQSYSKPSLHADLSDSDTDYESEAFDSGEVVERDSQFMLSPKDAISSSEMLKLLPESSGSQKSKSGSLALPTPLKLGNSTDTEEYTLMSPPAVSVRDPLSPSYTFPSTSPSTSSQYAPNLWQGRQVNVEDSKYKGNLPSYPRNGGIHNGLSNLASLGQENKIASWLAGNTEESIRSASTTSPTSEGSKESNSSAGSNHKFHTANGHGPFSHQQTAFC